MLSPLIKCASIAFIMGLLAGTDLFHVGKNLFDLAGAIVFIGAAFVVREMIHLERATGTGEPGLHVSQPAA